MSKGKGVCIGIRLSNGRKDAKYRYSISLTPEKIDEAIADAKNNLKSLKEWKKQMQDEPERFDFTREKI